MFSNFLYFLVALVIYISSGLFDNTKSVDPNNLYYSLILLVGFAWVCHKWFKKLAQKSEKGSYPGLDTSINGAISKLSLVALMLFAANIYLFKLNLFVVDTWLFSLVPTLGAALFLGLFLLYLVIIWNAAYGVHKRYFPGDLTKKSYITSNISFSLPALLPWFFLSFFADMIRFLPPGPVRQYFNTTAGEIVYIVIFLIIISIFGPVLIKKLWGCSPLESGVDRTRIETICKRAGLDYADILKWELFGGSMITAGVMGLVGRFRYLLITPALIHALEDDEMDAVILHEIGHVQRYHMLFYLFFFLGFIACNFVFFEPMILLLYIAQPLYQVFSFIGIDKGDVYPAFICLALVCLFVLYFRFVFGFFMRNFERQADIHVYDFQSDASPLISTFYKIASLSRQSIDKPNWHHFGIGERIRFLEQCREEPSLIARHHRRVKKIIMGYFLLVFALFCLGYSISYGRAKDGFEKYIAKEILFQQLEVGPENSDLYVFVGDYYYNDKVYDKAVAAYENVIRIDSKNIHALNNLAWLFATCPDEQFRDGARSLELASKAVSLKREAFVLDTYAEALSVNKRNAEAIEVAKEALALAKDKRSYYREQVARFEKMGHAL
ncbi:MAG: M48 family metalloprotease [Desulfobacteraceae bacterium]|nr:M48 family metalloprotease [Desulfobacteraceae bacterium]